MKQYNYSETVKDVFGVYRLARSLIFFWIIAVVVYSLGKDVYVTTDKLSEFTAYWPNTIDILSNKIYFLTISSFVLVSKSLPIFFMLLYSILSFKTSRVLASSCTKSILVFWFVQAFNFVFVLPDKTGLFSYSSLRIDSDNSAISVLIMLCIAAPFIIFSVIRSYRSKKKQENSEDLSFSEITEGQLFRIPHNLYVAMISAIIALLFDVNIKADNQILSNGVLFGFALSLIVLPRQDLQRIMLFFIAPDKYQYAYLELSAHDKLKANESKSDMLQKKTEIDSMESAITAQAAKEESKNKIRKLLSLAGKKYVEVKYGELETRIKAEEDKLESADIDLKTYSQNMQKIMTEIESTYQEVNEREVKLIATPEDSDQTIK